MTRRTFLKIETRLEKEKGPFEAASTRQQLVQQETAPTSLAIPPTEDLAEWATIHRPKYLSAAKGRGQRGEAAGPPAAAVLAEAGVFSGNQTDPSTHPRFDACGRADLRRHLLALGPSLAAAAGVGPHLVQVLRLALKVPYQLANESRVLRSLEC